MKWMKRVLLLLTVHWNALDFAQAGWCDDSEEWELVWSDEFEVIDFLDRRKWNIECTVDSTNTQNGPIPPDDNYAGCDVGAGLSRCRAASCMPDNVYVRNGHLTLVSNRVSHNATNQTWASGAVSTWNKSMWSIDDGPYRVCVRAKLPGMKHPGSGTGMWPAHWLMPNDFSCDPDEGEMDIMEMINGDAMALATYHWQTTYPPTPCQFYHNNTGHLSVGGGMNISYDREGFYEYGVEQSHDNIRFAIDQGITLDVAQAAHLQNVTPRIWNVPYYLILNTAIGGNGMWPAPPTEETISPTFHRIDYVRVARKRSATKPKTRTAEQTKKN